MQQTSCHMPSRLDEAAKVLRRRGVLLRKHPGFYSVCLRHDRDEDAYQTEDFADAFNHRMAMDVPPAAATIRPARKRADAASADVPP